MVTSMKEIERKFLVTETFDIEKLKECSN